MISSSAIKRPLLRWHGGKWRLAPWIISHFPPHRIYTEAFGGAASVLLRKEPAYAEVYNDLDATLVGLFRVLREPDQAARLIRSLELTPFAREEFDLAYEPCEDPVESARRTIVRSFMGFGSDGTNGVYRTGFRSNSNRSGTTPARDWTNYTPALRQICERIRPIGAGGGVVLESRNALEVLKTHDGIDTLHFVDPPYLPETRSAGNRRRGAGYHVYVHDMETEDHLPLLDLVQRLTGMVVLCGYPSPLYDDALVGWHRVQKSAHADGARDRTEVLWLNRAATHRLSHFQMAMGFE